ncbi:MAG: cytochrome c3 family protein, partial [Candidatus Zixiibacteriota bacterium]
MTTMRNLRLLFGFGLAVAIAAFAVPILAQRNSPAPMPTVNCRQCHTCEVPTLREPCLVSCPRTQMVHQSANHALQDAPDSMLLSQLADLYQPVHFNHKVHASMAQMGTNCVTCHHYSPVGQIPPCRDCHSPLSESTDLKKPNLKGAYHRQC